MFLTSFDILSLSFAMSFSVFLSVLCGILSADDKAVTYPRGPSAFLIFFSSVSLNDIDLNGVSFNSFLDIPYSEDIIIGAGTFFSCSIVVVYSCLSESVSLVSLVIRFCVWSSIHALLFHVFMFGFLNILVSPVSTLMFWYLVIMFFSFDIFSLVFWTICLSFASVICDNFIMVFLCIIFMEKVSNSPAI